MEVDNSSLTKRKLLTEEVTEVDRQAKAHKIADPQQHSSPNNRCITVRYTAPVECLFWRRSHMRVLGRRLVELISDMSLEEHPIFFHVFSNGGAFLYQHVSQAMQSQDKPLKVKGCIFDSAPGERRVSSLFRAIAAIVGGHWLYSTAVAAVATLACLVVWWLESLARSLRERKALDAEPIHLEEEPFRWPQLLVYSSRDRLICYKDVEKFAQHRRERGVAVTAVRFEDSPHVQHFLVHRDVYISSVCGFLHACLAPEDPGLPGAGRPN